MDKSLEITLHGQAGPIRLSCGYNKRLVDLVASARRRTSLALPITMVDTSSHAPTTPMDLRAISSSPIDGDNDDIA